MCVPFIYVRDKAKGHGRQHQVEGFLEPGSNVVVIEDLISTGGSSLKAVAALKEARARVLGMMAIFTYGFPVALENFEEAGVRLNTLSDSWEEGDLLNTAYALEQSAGFVAKPNKWW